MSYVDIRRPTDDLTKASALNGRSVSWSFDGIYRLTNETVTGDANSKYDGSVSYSGLDPVGNRTSASSTISGLTPVSGSYDLDDELTSSEGYNANGDVTSSGANHFSYDSQNELVSMNGGAVQVMYDGDGNRVAKSVTANGVTTITRYLVDDLNPTGLPQVMDELTNGVVTRTYSYGLQRIAQDQIVNSAWTPSFFTYDGTDNVRELTNASGTVTDTYEYDGFGNEINSTGSTPNTYLYRGEQWDPDLGLYYLRARYYNPLSGRFFSADPLASQGQKRYEYADADPVDEADPTGQAAILEFLLLNFRGDLQVRFPNLPPYCQVSRSNPMADDLPGCNMGGGGGGELGGEGGRGPCAGPNCNKDYWITFAYYPEATHGFGHDGVAVGTAPGVKSDDDDGWATKTATPFWKLALGISVPGLLREDSGVYGPTDGRKSRMGGRQVLYFKTNQAGAEAAEDLIKEWQGNNRLWSSWQDYPRAWPYDKSVGSYNLYVRNCAQFAEDVLHAGNVPGVPDHTVIEPALLWSILAYEQSW